MCKSLMIRAEIFPFFHHAAVGQMAYAVFAAIFVFADFGLAAFLLAEDGSGIRHADLRLVVRGGFRVCAGRKRNGSHSGRYNQFVHFHRFPIKISVSKAVHETHRQAAIINTEILIRHCILHPFTLVGRFFTQNFAIIQFLIYSNKSTLGHT